MESLLPHIVLILSGIVTYCVALNIKSKKCAFPLVGQHHGNAEQRRKAYNKDAGEIYMEGYQKYQDKPFLITTFDGEHIVVPISALDELRHLKDDILGNTESLEGNYEPKYTGKIANMAFLIELIRSDMTRSLKRINPRLAVEAESTVAAELGSCRTWTQVVIYEKLLRIVATVSGNMFLGPELCRREEWLHCSMNFTSDMARGVRKLKQWHAWLRPIAARFFTPEINTIWEHRKKANEFLVPIIQARKAAMERRERDLPDDLLQWMINMAPSYKLNNEDMAQLQLTLSMVSIHTTTMSLADILADLAIRPELVIELREEISRVLQNSCELGTHELFQMKLLDSVMRESQRLNPVAQQRFVRDVVKPITLSDGTYIPKGSQIEAAHGRMMKDARLYPDPEKYDPYRFLKLRTTNVPDIIGYENREQKYQFISVPKENMGFGFGRHACPGRFFAANEMKLILISILLECMYDPMVVGYISNVEGGSVWAFLTSICICAAFLNCLLTVHLMKDDIRMPNEVKTRYKGIVQGSVTFCDPSNKFQIRKRTEN